MTRWLTLVGIGADGRAGLSPAARTLVDEAEVLVGGKRHLARAGAARNGQERLAWSSPLTATIEQIVAMRGRRVVVLASGDPLHFGVGATLARHVDSDEMMVVPSPSAFALAAARLVWPLDHVTTISVHGRPAELVTPHVTPDARLLILANDAETPGRIAAMLTKSGFGESRMRALAHLGSAEEARYDAPARDWAHDVPDLHVLAITCVAGPDAIWHPRTGLPDGAYVHDGKLTKRDVRTSAIAKLMPHRGAGLVDIGAGCGSVAIEWLRAEPNTHAIAIEPRTDRRTMAAQNAAALGVPHLDIRNGKAPDALAGLAAPDAIFVGGGVTPATLDAAIETLKPGGCLVAHAVTLESEAVLLAAHQRIGGDLVRLSLAHAAPIGDFHGWRPAMPVTQWAWRKP